MYWMNIDVPDITCTIHHCDCGYIPNKETPLKGIQRWKIHGGWYFFNSLEEAKHKHQLDYSILKFRFCRCIKLEEKII
jgi:hypothetical protein